MNFPDICKASGYNMKNMVVIVVVVVVDALVEYYK
jgi:hypothetical protein